jgi:hypothetical protein
VPGVIPQKMATFIITAVRISNPALALFNLRKSVFNFYAVQSASFSTSMPYKIQWSGDNSMMKWKEYGKKIMGTFVICTFRLVSL